jgi:glutaredoxin
MTQTIQCPYCHKDFPLDDAIGHQLEEKIRQEFDTRQKQKDLEISEKEKALDEKAQKLETVQKDLVNVVNGKVEEKLRTEKLEIEKKAEVDADTK